MREGSARIPGTGLRQRRAIIRATRTEGCVGFYGYG
jgi:hypothetical protein